MLSSNSQKQLADLKIDCLIDFIEYNEEEKIPDFKNTFPNYLKIQINKDIPMVFDFD